jgi:predicted RNA-binding Zn-ribbon protein involved in translation (DUF1610 family)
MNSERVERDRPAAEFLCPICGEANRCLPAASGTFETPCWCAAAEFPAELLDRLDIADRGRSCLCPRCAGTEIDRG